MATLLRESRQIVYARSRGYCEHCGQPLGNSWQLHHRLPGGMGGTTRAGVERDAPSNLLALIAWHHNLHPDSVHQASKVAREAGWLISTHDLRPPSQVPVRLGGTRFVLLDDDGGWKPV